MSSPPRDASSNAKRQRLEATTSDRQRENTFTRVYFHTHAERTERIIPHAAASTETLNTITSTWSPMHGFQAETSLQSKLDLNLDLDLSRDPARDRDGDAGAVVVITPRELEPFVADLWTREDGSVEMLAGIQHVEIQAKQRMAVASIGRLLARFPHVKSLALRDAVVLSPPPMGLGADGRMDVEPLTQIRDLRITSSSNRSTLWVLEHVPHLQSLSMVSCGLTSLPSQQQIFGLTGLLQLDLQGNNITDLPDDLFAFLPSIRSASLQRNTLKTLPPTIVFCQSMTALHIGTNFIKKLPPLPSLEVLDWSNNDLKQYPQESLEGLSSLQHLSLARNGFSSLTQVHARQQNRNHGAAHSIFPFPLLRSLDLSQNEIETVPDSISSLEHLTWLSLARNRIQNSPEFVGKLPTLVSLNLSSNFIAAFPKGITNCVSLKTLDMSGNDIPVIPRVILQMGISELFHGRNRLSIFPEIPRQVYSTLVSLRLPNNRLATFPKQLTYYPFIRSIDLAHNKIAFMPHRLSEFMMLTYLSMENNGISYLPDSLFGTQSLRSLNLSHNALSVIPGAISRLLHLETINLSHNLISEMPSTFTNLQSLRYMDFSMNKLVSTPDLTVMTRLVHANLAGNCLTQVPHELVAFLGPSNLITINNHYITLVENMAGKESQWTCCLFPGRRLAMVPPELAGFSRLTQLDLQKNFLSFLPDSFAALDTLVHVDLSENAFTSIPNPVVEWKNMKTLNMRMNMLMGFPDIYC
eukprot:TRINITY_DN1880_c0_g1_i7.p1 TRINITY_DN1880_c0_g1~~TRINITY_DN1880_c0_g1_i7.p1  ORF type:complete len:751 (+),score=128.70 TRINITY_DN1880_c0_g1_i7:42-2294(+)